MESHLLYGENPALTVPMGRFNQSRVLLPDRPAVLIAGQGTRDPLTNEYAGIVFNWRGVIVLYRPFVQAMAVFENLERAANSNGLDRNAFVAINMFLTHKRDFRYMNMAWDVFFKPVPDHLLPTRTTIIVSGVPGTLNMLEGNAIMQDY